MENDTQPTVWQICRRGCLEGRWDRDEFGQLCRDLANYDRRVELLKKCSGIGAGVCIVLCLIAGAAENPTLAGVLFVVFLVLLVLTLVLRQLDLADHARVYLEPLVSQLIDDVKPGPSIFIQMPLTPVAKKANMIGQSAPYAQGAYYHVIDYMYKRRLLRLDLRLHDGNRIRIQVDEASRKRVRTKRSISGKTKTKTKYKTVLDYTHCLFINAEQYPLAEFPNKPLSYKERSVRPCSNEKGNQLISEASTKQAGQCPPVSQVSLDHIMTLYAVLQTLQTKNKQNGEG